MSIAIRYAVPVILGLALAWSIPEEAHAQANESVITINGSITGPTCVLSTPSMEVELPDVATYQFTHVGQNLSISRVVNIVLTNCTTATANQVVVAFTGLHAASAPTHLQTSIPGLSLVMTSTFTGVTGDVAMDGTEVSYPLSTATLNLPFALRYVVETLPIVSGLLTARATFTLSYS